MNSGLFIRLVRRSWQSTRRPMLSRTQLLKAHKHSGRHAAAAEQYAH